MESAEHFHGLSRAFGANGRRVLSLQVKTQRIQLAVLHVALEPEQASPVR